MRLFENREDPPMTRKVLLVTDNPALRLRLANGLPDAEVHLARDEREVREVMESIRADTGEADSPGSEAPWLQPGEILAFEEYERRILLHALVTTGWNVKQAAQRLGIGRATLYRKIDRYDLRGRNRNAG